MKYFSLSDHQLAHLRDQTKAASTKPPKTIPAASVHRVPVLAHLFADRIEGVMGVAPTMMLVGRSGAVRTLLQPVLRLDGFSFQPCHDADELRAGLVGQVQGIDLWQAGDRVLDRYELLIVAQMPVEHTAVNSEWEIPVPQAVVLEGAAGEGFRVVAGVDQLNLSGLLAAGAR